MLKNRWSWLSSVDPPRQKHPWSKGIHVTSFPTNWCPVLPNRMAIDVGSKATTWSWKFPRLLGMRLAMAAMATMAMGCNLEKIKKWDGHIPTSKNMNPESRIHIHSPTIQVPGMISYEIHIPPLLELPLTALTSKAPDRWAHRRICCGDHRRGLGPRLNLVLCKKDMDPRPMLHMAWSRNARDDKIQVAPRSSCHVWCQLEVPTIALLSPSHSGSWQKREPNCKRVLKLGVLRFCNQPFLDIFEGFFWRVWDILVWHQKCLQRVQMNAPLTTWIQVKSSVSHPDGQLQVWYGGRRFNYWNLCTPHPGYPGIFEVSFVRCSLVTTKARTRVNLMSDKWHWQIQGKKEILKSTYGVSVYSITL